MDNNLIKRATEIRDEKKESANTAKRVGKLFLDMINTDMSLENRFKAFSKEITSWGTLKINRGQWSEAVARSKNPYRFFDQNRISPDGIHEYNQMVQHTVYNYGCLWGCIKDGTVEPPTWNCKDWIILEDFSVFHIVFESTNGSQAWIGHVDTVIYAKMYYASNDISEALLENNQVVVEWSRDTGYAAGDKMWAPEFVDGKLNVIHLTNADVGAGFGYDYRKVTFTIKVHFPRGENFVTKEAKIMYKI